MGRRGKPEKVKASGKRPSARTARKDESAQVRNLEKQLADANERQAATAEILRVISQSPTEVQPVFDTIAQNAVKLCGADISVVTTVDGETLQLVAMYGLTPEGAEAVRRDFPMPLNAQSTSARTIRNRAVVHVEDVRGGADYQYKDTARAWDLGRADASGHTSHRSDHGGAVQPGALRRRSGCPAEDLRRPGRHRDWERAAVHGAPGQESGAHAGACASHRSP